MLSTVRRPAIVGDHVACFSGGSSRSCRSPKLLGAVAVLVLVVAFGRRAIRCSGSSRPCCAVALAGWAVRDLVAPVRLARTPSGVTVVVGFARRRHCPGRRSSGYAWTAATAWACATSCWRSTRATASTCSACTSWAQHPEEVADGPGRPARQRPVAERVSSSADSGRGTIASDQQDHQDRRAADALDQIAPSARARTPGWPPRSPPTIRPPRCPATEMLLIAA